MEERKLNFIIDTLSTDPDYTYEVYLRYIRETGKTQTIFRCVPDEIDKCFSSPSKAVEAYLNAGVRSLDHNNFVLVTGSRAEFFDNFEASDLKEVIEWTLTDPDAKWSLYDCIERLDVWYYFPKVFYKSTSEQSQMSDWLMEREFTVYDIIDMDWDYIYAKYLEEVKNIV